MLDISPIIMLSSAVIFLVVLAQLNKSLYQPLYKHMEDRTQSIKSDLELAKSNVADVEDIYSEASSIIAVAKQEASLIRESAYNEAKTLGDKQISEFRNGLDNKYSAFVKDLGLEKESLKSTLTENIPQFKEKLSAKLSSI